MSKACPEVGPSLFRRLRVCCRVFLVIVLGSTVPFVADGLNQGHSNVSRPVTVADMIQMTELGHGIGFGEDQVAQFSPDGESFVVVLRKGNLEKNINEYSILLWRTQKIPEPSAPEVLLTMSSSSNRRAIQHLSWLRDNETIVFLGEHPGESQQLYAFNTRTRVSTKLTQHATNLVSYSITLDGRRFAFYAEEPISTLLDP